MRCLFFLIFLTGFPAMGQAATTVVQSGEHADFSRIVLQLGAPPEWEFGRVQGGYELRFSVDAKLDLSKVFDRIPKTRILSLSQVGPNTLYFEVECDCAGDAFEIRAGRLVVDIKNGPADPDSPFERKLSAFPTEPNNAPTRIADRLEIGSGLEPTPRQLDFEILDSSMRQYSIGVSEPDATLPNIDAPYPEPADVARTGETDGFVNEMQETKAGMAAPQMGITPISDETGHDALKTPTNVSVEANKFTPVPDSLPDFEMFKTFGQAGGAFSATGFLDNPLNQTVNQAQSALLAGLLRASSQGLVSVESPQLALPPRIEHEAEELFPAPVLESELPTAAGETSLKDGEHLRIETAVDRSAVQTDEPTTLSHDGDICLPTKYFDVRNWGEAGQRAHSLDILRASLIGEFDKPDPVAVERLAQRYIFMGFGAEAKAVLDIFDAPTQSAKILRELASILDENQLTKNGIVQAQASCATSASLWGILALDAIPEGNVHDVKAVLRTFSGLPVHLRQHLGPQVAARFLAAEDIEAAKAIRDLIDRASATDGPRFNLTEARIAATSGNISQSIDSWNLVVDADSPQSAVALVEMIDATLENGQPVREAVARSADALAVEYRGLELGRQLMRASIRAFATNGNTKTTFARISSAIRTGDMAPNEALELRAEAHLRNASNSSDGEFLEIAFENEFSDLDQSVATTAARKAVAGRLLELGFSLAAWETVAPIVDNNDEDLTLLRAKIAFTDGHTASAIEKLAGLHSQAADQLRAKISEQSGDFKNAVRLYEKFGDADARDSAAWRSADWNQISNLGIPGKSAAAKLALSPGLQPQSAAAGTDADTKETIREKSVAHGRSLLQESRVTLDVINELLGTNAEF